MSAAMNCPKCGFTNQATNRFCTGCGHTLDADDVCRGCGTGLRPGQKFCHGCGSAVVETEIPEGPGYVSDGQWNRGRGEFVRRVEMNAMRGFFDGLVGKPGGILGMVADHLQARSIRVPAGSVAAVVIDGQVDQVLPPGEQTTVGWFQGLLGRISGESGRTAFYLIDRRPVPVPFSVQTAGTEAGHRINLQVLAQVHVVGNQSDKDRLSLFINNLLGGRDSMSDRDVYRRFKPEIERATKAAVARYATSDGIDYGAIEAELRQVLAGGPGKQYGVHFELTVAPVSTLISVDVHLGAGQTPNLRACVSCSAEIHMGQRFCTTCGAQQPTERSPGRSCTDCGANVPVGSKFCTGCGTPFTEPAPGTAPLLTADKQQVELDLVLRCQGERDLVDQTPIIAALAAAAARLLRSTSYAELTTAAGFETIQGGLRRDAEMALRALGLRLIDVTVLDVRSKTGEWEMNARADLDRARREMVLDREWLEIDGENLDIQALALGLVLKQKTVQREHDFQLHAAELEDARRRDELAVADREARQDLADRSSTLDVTDAQRDAQRDVAVDSAGRDRERALRDADHTDTLSRDQQGRVVDDARAEHGRAAQTTQMGHEMSMERQAAEHDAALAREASQLSSEQGRLAADDQAYADSSRLDTRFSEDERRQRMELDAESEREAREAQRKKEEWEMMLAAEAAIGEREMAAAAQQQTHEQAILARQSQMDTGQILAASGRELSDAEATAMAQMATGADAAAAEAAERESELKERMYERMMAESRETRDSTSAQQAQMMTMMQQMMQQQMQQNQANLQTMAQSQAQSQAATQAAYQGSAEQARSMSERSMDAMSNVASSRAQPPVNVVPGAPWGGPVVPPPSPRTAPPAAQPPATQPTPPPAAPKAAAPKAGPACKNCGVSLTPGSGFCGECGTRQ